MRASHRRRATPERLIVIDHIVFGVRARRRGNPSRAYWGRRVIACHGEFLGLAGLDPGVRRTHEIGQDDPVGNRPTCGRPPAAAHLRRVALVRTRFAAKTADWGKKASALPVISAMALVRASRLGRLVDPLVSTRMPATLGNSGENFWASGPVREISRLGHALIDTELSSHGLKQFASHIHHCEAGLIPFRFRPVIDGLEVVAKCR